MAVLERSGNSYLNARGDVVLAGPYAVAGPFREGLARVGRFVRDPDGGHYSLGFIDPQGRQVIAEQYADVQDFHHGLAVVQLADERMGRSTAATRCACLPPNAAHCRWWRRTG